ncbi:uncharacterized protein [Choristoneura fumiferana]|uniref:uncharacterized protein n=1 Tax=Choristoneura fumiferana TaxID=7141 RepID=UPI003D1557DC
MNSSEFNSAPGCNWQNGIIAPQSQPSTSGGSKKSKRERTAFTTHQLTQLEAEYGKDRFIKSIPRKNLAAQLKISERSIKIWYQNRRMKEKKDLKMKMKSPTDPHVENCDDDSTMPSFEMLTQSVNDSYIHNTITNPQATTSQYNGNLVVDYYGVPNGMNIESAAMAPAYVNDMAYSYQYPHSQLNANYMPRCQEMPPMTPPFNGCQMHLSANTLIPVTANSPVAYDTEFQMEAPLTAEPSSSIHNQLPLYPAAMQIVQELPPVPQPEHYSANSFFDMNYEHSYPETHNMALTLNVVNDTVQESMSIPISQHGPSQELTDREDLPSVFSTLSRMYHTDDLT